MATTSPTRASVHPLLGRSVRANLPTAELYEDAIRRGEGLMAAEGPLVVRTGKHTGRSPEDKFIVREPGSESKIWWGKVNRPISEAHYERLRARLTEYATTRDLYSQDCFIGAAPAHRRSLRVYTETAWASIFARNLFRRTSAAQLADFAPNFTIICVPSFQADPATEGTRTGTAILVHLRRMEVLIVGTEYAGEIKKSAFTVMNYLMPDEGVLPMHSAVNVGADGDAAIFFGLSGTGKTTLSADPRRSLVGDDEHGWGDGITFNFEGGCYAKTIRLSPMYEPDIFQTTRRFGTILENVDLDPAHARAGPRLGAVHREHPGRLPARVHRQRRRDRDRRDAPRDRLPDGRCLRGPAADLAPHPGAGRLPLHQRLHGQARGHRGRDQGTEGHVLGLFRRAVHAAPSWRVRSHADRPAGARRRARLAGQHRLDRWPLRDRGANEHRPHPGDGPGGPRRDAVERPDPDGSDLRVRGAHVLPGDPRPLPRSAGHLGRSGRL